ARALCRDGSLGLGYVFR
ncbi:phosphotransferase enzyme family protein, partial [Vibrio parahaemolyticus V-223/04]